MIKRIAGHMITVIFCLVFISCENDSFFELKSPPATEWRNVKDLEYGIASVYEKYLNRRATCSWAACPEAASRCSCAP